MTPTWLSVLLPFVFLVAFPALWCGVAWLLSRLGWARLAASYETDAPRTGRTFRFVSGTVGLTSYNNALTVSIEPDGLRLAVPFLFRVGHPPLLLPWDEIRSIEPHTVLWHTAYKLTLTAPTAATVRLPQRVIEAVRDAAPRDPA